MNTLRVLVALVLVDLSSGLVAPALAPRATPARMEAATAVDCWVLECGVSTDESVGSLAEVMRQCAKEGAMLRGLEGALVVESMTELKILAEGPEQRLKSFTKWATGALAEGNPTHRLLVYVDDMLTPLINLELDAAVNRLRIAESMKKAAELADAGDLEAGTQMMRDAVAHAQRTPSSGMPLMQEMFDNVAALEENFKDATSYRSLGAGATKSAAVAWHAQKSSTHAAAYYRGSSKGKARKEASDAVLGKRGSDDDDDDDDDTPGPIGKAPVPKRQMTGA